MNVLWIYDKAIEPYSGGTERVTYLVMSGLTNRTHHAVGALVFTQSVPRKILDSGGQEIHSLYAFLIENNVDIVVNQIGYSSWLLEEFLFRGGQQWCAEGGAIITCLHFDPLMFPETLVELLRNWRQRTLGEKVRRLGRITLLPFTRRKAKRDLGNAYAYLMNKSDRFVVLSERHLKTLNAMCGSVTPGRVVVIPNPNTFSNSSSVASIGTKSKTVLIVSRLDEPQKRVSLALRAWESVMRDRRYTDWELQVVGDGDYLEDYLALVDTMKIPNIRFLGRTDPEPYYEKACIYLHTSKREGWGLTIVEAMQKGVVPIVMNSCAVFQDMIRDGYNGILSTDKDVAQFALNVSGLMLDHERRYRLARRAIRSSHRNNMQEVLGLWYLLFKQTGRRERG